jgi:hypothetical protein
MSTSNAIWNCTGYLFHFQYGKMHLFVFPGYGGVTKYCIQGTKYHRHTYIYDSGARFEEDNCMLSSLPCKGRQFFGY